MLTALATHVHDVIPVMADVDNADRAWQSAASGIAWGSNIKFDMLMEITKHVLNLKEVTLQVLAPLLPAVNLVAGLHHSTPAVLASANPAETISARCERAVASLHGIGGCSFAPRGVRQTKII
eukprot:14364660-Alexandrium_andersonii.AAC.1